VDALRRRPEFTDCVRSYLLARDLECASEQTTGGVKLNGKVILAAVGALALLGIGFGTLVGATAPAHASSTTDTSAGETAESEVPDNGLDSGLESNHDFEGDEEGEF